MWRHLLFDTLYRLGRPIWDTPPPQELCDAIEGPNAMPPGHALDVGCGTGTNVIYLAKHGWQATGIDFSAAAIRKARTDAHGIDGATFIEGDVTLGCHTLASACPSTWSSTWAPITPCLITPSRPTWPNWVP